MARVELLMPKMGESIMEATILKWRKKPGDKIELDEAVLEIATDKVDSEVPSPIAGVLVELLFNENDVVPINKVIAIIETDAALASSAPSAAVPTAASNGNGTTSSAKMVEVPYVPAPQVSAVVEETGRFYSPLVRTIAQTEGIGQSELNRITGTGSEGRVTKKDILDYVATRSQVPTPAPQAVATQHFDSAQRTPTNVVSTPQQSPNQPVPQSPNQQISQPTNKPAPSISGGVEIIEMDRMRKLIADHMVMSKHTSPHVTSFVEVDVTNMVNWRNKIKEEYKKKYGQNITFTPMFIEAVVRAIRDFPMINSSVDGTKIYVKKDINIGMAAALPTGNLIVPVIKNADYLNLAGLTKSVNDLAGRARNNQLKPDEIQGGTFTITNVGTFGNVMGTPIINQPQVAILATGAIKKKPAVLETEFGDVIAVRQMMFLSLSYDHRVVDGMLGGSFLRRIADYLEQFDANRSI
jgi:2-oxoglutarate dehydrogenase E2 component (dihydrolipoamide succinyltransferase)